MHGQQRDVTRFAHLAQRAVAEATGLPMSAGETSALEAEKRAAFSLARLSGREASVTFDHLVSLLLLLVSALGQLLGSLVSSDAVQ